MAQAQPRPPARRSRRSRLADGEHAVAAVPGVTPREIGLRPVGGTRGRVKVGLSFVCGLALGYGLSGPLPRLVGPVLAGLSHATPAIASLVNPLAERRILVMGTDQVGANTDVLLTLQVKDGITRLTQVPRDTYIESEGHGVLKANALYAVGGVETVKEELSRLLSVPVERYVMVNLDAVQRLAEAVGGVEVDVPKRMAYVDNSQGLYIDLYPGLQLLKGRDLEGFLRFRHDELGDIGRLERQKMVLRQVFRKLADPATVTRLPELLQVAGRDIRTDLSPVELGALVSAMAGTRLSTASLPGRAIWQDDLSYWMPASNPRYREIPEDGEVEAAATAP